MCWWVFTRWRLAGTISAGTAANAGYVIRTPAMSILFGFACCYLGFGSGLFHASLTRLGQQLDVAAMYSPLVAAIAMNVGRWMPRLNRMVVRRVFRPGQFWPAWPWSPAFSYTNTNGPCVPAWCCPH